MGMITTIFFFLASNQATLLGDGGSQPAASSLLLSSSSSSYSYDKKANGPRTSYSFLNSVPHRIPHTTAYPCERKTLGQVKDNMYSQQGEDAELLSRFNGLCGGTYVELGALDGVTFSNSFVFHAEFAWTGVLVELDAEMYQDLMRNRCAHEMACVHGAVCASTDTAASTATTTTTSSKTIHYVSGHSAVNGIWEFASQEFREQWWPNIEGPEELQVMECGTLQEILDRHVGGHDPSAQYYFDFLSLDVEGSEWTVLQSIDWERTAFGVIAVEAPDHKGLEQDSIVTFLQLQGYRYLGEKHTSLWFLHGFFHEIYKTVT